nr:MAG TPA: minor capsid protein [Caudoviricetes sp.]
MGRGSQGRQPDGRSPHLWRGFLMLPPSALDRLPDAFVDLWQGVEDEILKDIARRIAKTGTITETANWQLWRYQQTEALRNDVVKLLAKYSGKSDAAIRQLLLQAATEAMEREDAIYYHYGLEPTPFEESPALNNLLDAGARQTAGTWKNLTATTANTVTGQFERTLDAAWAKVSTGAFDYKTAVKQAVDSLADGMKFVTYPTGHQDSIEVAARRAILTGVNQTAGKLQVARADEMGVEFFETTAHGGARPSHAEWQGRQFHRGGAVDYMGKYYPDFEAATGYGTGAGLCGWNCRHTFFAVFPELGDPPAWTRDQLEELNARNIEWNGKKYTAYEISQMQRARERNVRRWKKRYLAEDAAGLDPTDAAVRLRAARQSLAEFTQATGGRVDSARTSVHGFGRSASSKAAWAVRHNTLTNTAGQTIIKVSKSNITGPRNGITQKTNAKGGIDRNYYGPDGRQTKQISNNGHGHKVEEALGKHGEHAHDYIFDAEGHLCGRPSRELTDAERKENSDIL